MGLGKTVKNLFRTSINNRVTLMGFGVVGVGLAEKIYAMSTGDVTYDLFGTGMLFLGEFSLAVTGLGVQTQNSYLLTKKHIKQEGNITPEWIEPKLAEYCVRQGVYLACRDTGNMASFREACKKTKIYIPNF